MESKTGKCPACGNQTTIPDDRDDFFCLCCGKSLHIKRAKPANTSAASTQSSIPALQQFNITDARSGLPLAQLMLPGIFKVQGSILPNASCSEYPIKMTCAAYDPMGTTMTFFTGEGFVDSTKCPMMNGPYAQPVNRVNRIVYRRFIDAETYADDYIRKVTAGSGAQGLRFIEDRPLPMTGFNATLVLQQYQFLVERDMHRSGGQLPPVLDWYIKPVCRIYQLTIGGRVYQVALVLLLEAVKVQMPFAAAPVMPDFFGGLFGRKKQTDHREAMNRQDQDRQAGFAYMPDNAVINWRSDGVFMLQTVPEAFDAAFRSFFRQFCSSLKVSQQFLQRTEQMKDQINQDIAAVTQANIRQQQAQFAAWQQANATRQAAFDAANQAWWARSNATHAANHAAGMAGESAEDRMSRLRSEAIRGVNTYVREDGTETEVSVDYNRVYSNATHDTLASNSSFEPGGNWTEMHRKG